MRFAHYLRTLCPFRDLPFGWSFVHGCHDDSRDRLATGWYYRTPASVEGPFACALDDAHNRAPAREYIPAVGVLLEDGIPQLVRLTGRAPVRRRVRS